MADLQTEIAPDAGQTQDIGRVFDDGSFEIEGRIDRSDIRGCNLLVQ